MLITKEVPDLQSFIKLNLLNIAEKFCTDCDFVPWAVIDTDNPNARAQLDFAMRKDSLLCSLGKMKGK